MLRRWTTANARSVALAGLVLSIAAFAAGAGEPGMADLEEGLESATGAERLELLIELAYQASYRSVEEGRRYGEQALVLARELGDRNGEARALRNLAVADSVACDHQASIARAEQALSIFEELGDQRRISSTLNVIGVGHRMLHEYDKALECYERALVIDRARGKQSAVARTLTNVANIHGDRGDFSQCVEVNRQVVAIKRELDDPESLGSTLINLGIALFRMGDHETALEHLLEALRLCEEADNLDCQASAALTIGNLFDDGSQLDRARDYFQRALDAYTTVGNIEGMASASHNLGNVAQRQERYDDALTLYQEAYNLRRETGDLAGQAGTLDTIGTLKRRMGAYQEALELHRQALSLREPLGRQQETAISLENVGTILTLLGRYDEALPYLERALAIAQETGAADNIYEILVNLTDLHAAAGRFEVALGYARQAAKTREAYLNDRAADRIAELETRYQLDARTRRNELLTKENEIRVLEASRARLRANLFLAVLAIVLIGVVALLRRYRDLLRFWKRKSLIGHYRIVDTIAEGGMGVVYRAESLVDRSRPFALKLIRDEHATDSSVRRRFLHEAAVVDQLDHPNIVHVHERGEDSGRLYIAMELLEGPSLADLIRRGEGLDGSTCLHIMRQLAGAVEAIHAKGVLHRDLKPANVVLVERDGDSHFVKLLDFGLARSQSLTRMTETGTILGTLAYLSPEQITEQTFSPKSDVFALGVVFYELLTLKPAFPGDTPVQIIRQILRGEVVPPRQYCPDLSEDLEQLVLAMISSDPAARPADRDIVERLETL